MASSRVKFYYHNWVVQDATEIIIDPAKENAFFPVANIKSPFSTKVYRSPEGEISTSFILDLKTIAPIDTVLVKGHALTGFGINTLNVKASGSLDFLTPLLDVNVELQNKYNLGSAFFTEVSARYWKFTLSSTSEFCELSNLFIGKGIYLPFNNFENGWKYSSDDNSKRQYNEYGQQYSDQLNSIKSIEGSFNLLTQDELATLEEITEACGITKPFWFILDSEEIIYADKELFAGQFYFVEKPDIKNVSFGLYQLPIKMREAI